MQQESAALPTDVQSETSHSDDEDANVGDGRAEPESDTERGTLSFSSHTNYTYGVLPGHGIPRARVIEAPRQALVATIATERIQDGAYLLHEAALIGHVNAMEESVGRALTEEEADGMILSMARYMRDRSNSVQPGAPALASTELTLVSEQKKPGSASASTGYLGEGAFATALTLKGEPAVDRKTFNLVDKDI